METTGKTTLPSTGCASDGTDMKPRRRAYLFARRSSQSLSVRGARAGALYDCESSTRLLGMVAFVSIQPQGHRRGRRDKHVTTAQSVQPPRI